MKHTAHSLIMLTASPNCLPNLRLCLAYTYKNMQVFFFMHLFAFGEKITLILIVVFLSVFTFVYIHLKICTDCGLQEV